MASEVEQAARRRDRAWELAEEFGTHTATLPHEDNMCEPECEVHRLAGEIRSLLRSREEAAFREGQEEMRERAANQWYTPEIAKIIRALQIQERPR